MYIKNRKCSPCDKTFKNSASLATHKNRYHPYSRRKTLIREDDLSSVNSDVSSLSSVRDLGLEMKIDDNKREIKALDRVFGDLVKRMEEFECTDRLQHTTTTSTMFKPQVNPIDAMSKDIEAVKFQSGLNKRKIQTLVNDIEEIKQSSDTSESDTSESETESIKVKGLIDNMMEIRDLFIARNFEALRTNIEDVKLAVNLMLRANMGSVILSSDEMALLEEIPESSNHQNRTLLKENFGQLVNTFKKLEPEFENIFQDEGSLHDETNDEKDSLEDVPEQQSETEQSEDEDSSDEDEDSVEDEEDNKSEDYVKTVYL